jgi:hypothetical protein
MAPFLQHQDGFKLTDSTLPTATPLAFPNAVNEQPHTRGSFPATLRTSDSALLIATPPVFLTAVIEQRASIGVTEGLVRVAVGIEGMLHLALSQLHNKER